MSKVRNAAFAALAMAVSVAPALAQSTEDVLAKYYEAIGGVDAWTGLQTMQASGTLDVMGMMSGPFSIVQKRPAMARIEITIQGMDIIQAYDGETAWQIMPMMGVTEPTLADEATTQQIVEQADLDGPLIGWEEDGTVVSFEGTETMDGAEAMKLKVTSRDGLVSYFYLDDSYLPYKVVAVRDIEGVATELTTSMGDYQEVDGLMFPFFIEIDTPMGAQSLMFESVEVNIDVDESVFSMSGN